MIHCKHFFKVDKTPNDRRLELIQVHLEGRALQWHQTLMSQEEEIDMNWHKYIQCLREQFGQHLIYDPVSELVNLKQIDSVLEYQHKFEELVSQLQLFKEHKISFYLGGLKKDIKSIVRLLKLKILIMAMNLAKLWENAFTSFSISLVLGNSCKSMLT